MQCWIIVSWNTLLWYFDGKDVNISCIYNPPNTNIEHFNSIVGCVLDKNNREGKVCFLVGDFNINLYNHKSHLPIADSLNIMYANSLFPFITKPNRLTSSSASLIDSIFTNYFNNLWKAGVFYSDISDNFPVFHLVSVSSVSHQEREPSGKRESFKL